MFTSRFIIPITAIIFLSLCCRKANLTDKECRNFKEGIEANDKDRVVKAVDHLLKKYSEENLNKFASSLSSECNINATVLCFGCIDTNPEQSEIAVIFTESSVVVRRILDVSYDNKNKMSIVAIHDY